MPAPELAIRLLGGFSVSIHGQEIPDSRWRLHKVKNLVKLLALARAHRLHRDQLIDTLWPESDPKAGSNLFYQTLHFARQVLADAGSNYLCFQDGFLSLSDGVWVDTEQFEQTAAHARHCQEPAEFHRALAFYTGCLLPEDLYEDWTVQPREALRQAYLSLLLDLAGVEESRGNYTAGIQTLQRLLADDPSSEAAHIGLMRLYALCGQRQQALRQYQILRDVLRAELDAEPSRYAEQLAEAIRCGRFAPTESPTIESPGGDARKTNLPAQLTSFIGREKQIEDIRRLMNDHRLVTLTGAGGIGKTRLALAAAEGLLLCFPDGVFLVELAPLSDPNLVAQECTKSLSMLEQPGIPYADALAYYLKNKHLLLILDNCEHVVAACTQLAGRLLKECPRLHILTTSREVFSVPGEIPFRVPSLEVVDHHARPPLAEMARVEAVRLFVERAADVSPGLALTEENAGWIAQIGQRLDGIPLAIELAAARTRMLTVEQIATRLDNLFHLLTSGNRAVLPRHQTLKATIDWSYDQLTSRERMLFQRLSVFAGSWMLDAVEAVCLGEAGGSEARLDAIEMLDLLGQLVDKSLVVTETSECGTRYRMLEVIHQYARDRLLETGKDREVRNRHLRFYAGLTGEAEKHLRGKGQIEWRTRLDEELDNLRAALDWSRESSIELGLQIASDMMWFWQIRGLFSEGIEWSIRLLAVEEQERVGAVLAGNWALQRARALRSASYLAGYIDGFTDKVRLAYLQESEALLRALGAHARRELGITLVFLAQYNMTLPDQEEILSILQQEQEKFYLSEYFNNLSDFIKDRGDLDQALAHLKISLAICEEIEDIDGIASRKKNMANYLTYLGIYLEAEALLQESMALFTMENHHWAKGLVYSNRLLLAMAQGNYAEVDRLNDEVLLIFTEYKLTNYSFMNAFILIRSSWSQGDGPRVQDLAGQIIEMDVDKYTNSVKRLQPIYVFLYQGRTALSNKDLAKAKILLKKAFLWAKGCDLPLERELLLLGCISLYAHQGKSRPAALLLGALQPFYQRTAGGLSPRERNEHDEALLAARSSLGDEVFEQAWQEGQQMSLNQAFHWAVAEMA